MNVTREELGVGCQQAHAHKLKLTGHLSSVTWPEVVSLGIDDLEQGHEFVTDKVRGALTDSSAFLPDDVATGSTQLTNFATCF